jgi:alpha-glucosidase (family GH31 glycosyl hydrolase)
MLDLAEIVPGDASYADGSVGTETHNRYPGLFSRASFEAARAMRGDDFVLFARSGSLGAQRHQSLQWPGDQTITWDQEGIGGLIPAGLSIGLSGFPYWHPEVGGFLGVGLPADSERELWFRWLQLGALSPLLRDQYGEHRGEPVEVWSDAETVAAFRTYARLHNSLVPYLYTQARVASETGLPIMRHLALLAPDDPRAWEQEDAYALGDDLLVAPVLNEGARLRTLYLPPGAWVDWWTGEVWDGGRTITVDAPLGQIPLFARTGAILPLAPDFDTLVPTTEPGTETWNGDLIVRVMRPDTAAERRGYSTDTVMRLYDGTTMRARFERGNVQLSVASAPTERGYALRLPAPSESPPRLVTLNGEAAQGWTFEEGVIGLDVRATAFTVTVATEESPGA